MTAILDVVAVQKDAKTRKRRVTIRERPMCRKSLDSDDVFILDKGEKVWLVSHW